MMLFVGVIQGQSVGVGAFDGPRRFAAVDGRRARALPRIALMPWRIMVALLRSPVTLLAALLCLGLAAIGFGGAYLLLTLGVQTFNDVGMAWALAVFGLLWGAFWLYMLGVAVRGAMNSD